MLDKPVFENESTVVKELLRRPGLKALYEKYRTAAEKETDPHRSLQHLFKAEEAYDALGNSFSKTRDPDGCWFYTNTYLFGRGIDKYAFGETLHLKVSK